MILTEAITPLVAPVADRGDLPVAAVVGMVADVENAPLASVVTEVICERCQRDSTMSIGKVHKQYGRCMKLASSRRVAGARARRRIA